MTATKSVPSLAKGGPHNGRPEYQVEWTQDWTYYKNGEKVTKTITDMVGGQVLMIRACMSYQRVVIAVGRRAGKSTEFILLVPHEAMHIPGRYTAMFIAQDHTKAKEWYQKALEEWGGLVKNKHADEGQDRWIELHPLQSKELGLTKNKGSKIYFCSGHHPQYEALRGYGFPFHRVAIDEAALIHEKILPVVTPMLVDAHGKLVVYGTPDEDGLGQEWFSDYFDKGQKETEPDWWSCNFPSHCNPLLSLEAIQALINDCRTSDAVEQEVYGKFLKGKGGVFTRLDEVFSIPFKWHVSPKHDDMPDWYYKAYTDIYSDPNAPGGGDGLTAWIAEDRVELGTYVLGVDWARVRDATVISVFCLDTMKQVAVFHFRQEDYDEQVQWVSTIRERYNNALIYSDQNGVGDSMTRTLMRKYHDGCIGIKFGADKGTYVRDAQQLFNHVHIKMINCDAQRNEFKKFRKEKSESTGRVKYTHTPNGNDDFVDPVLMMAEKLLHNRHRPRQPAPEKDAPGTMAYLRKQIKRRKKFKRLRESQI